jgi:hypothetical protein
MKFYRMVKLRYNARVNSGRLDGCVRLFNWDGAITGAAA